MKGSLLVAIMARPNHTEIVWHAKTPRQSRSANWSNRGVIGILVIGRHDAGVTPGVRHDNEGTGRLGLWVDAGRGVGGCQRGKFELHGRSVVERGVESMAIIDFFDEGSDGRSGMVDVPVGRGIDLFGFEGLHETFGHGRVAHSSPPRTGAPFIAPLSSAMSGTSHIRPGSIQRGGSSATRRSIIQVA